MAALLTSEIEDNNKRDIMVEHFEDAKRLGYPIGLPNVNLDMPDFDVVNGQILFGLVAIKGLGRGAAAEIVREREANGKFKDIFDFCERLDHRIVTKSAIEKLIKGGAMDCLGAKRSQMMDVLSRAMDAATALQRDKRMGQMNLFDAFEEESSDTSSIAESLPQRDEWPNLEKLKYEKEALDFYVSSHPLAQYEDLVQRFSTYTSNSLNAVPPGTEVLVGGMLTQVRIMAYKKQTRSGNTRYMRCRFEDFYGSLECVMWGDEYERNKDMVIEDHICFAGAVVERNRDEPSLVLTRLLSVDQVQKERTTGLVLMLSLEHHNEQHIDSIVRVIERSKGNCPVFLNIMDRFGKRSLMKAGSDFKINPETLAKAELETILGAGRVIFSRHGNGR